MSVRVRFAPAPTGDLHIGGAMVAVANHLLRVQQGGAFVLRIDDTDASGHAGGAAERIEETLGWLGITIDEGLDAMLARRDLSDYPPYKVAGNWVMSAWASLWAGQRLFDVESGYRIVRLGALAHALDYYQGYKYSETVELAVVLCRLGYRVRNDHLVPVPVFRSNTRMIDAVIGFMKHLDEFDPKTGKYLKAAAK